MFETLALVLIGVLAVCAVVASLYYFRRAQLHEAAQPDPTETVVEMRALGQRIETLVGQQQLQGETTRQQMAQKMDAVAEGMTQQRTHLAGLQNELRHEVRRRDAEMEEIRTQLASVQHAAARAALAAPAPLTLAPAPPATAPPTVQPPAFEAPTFEAPAFEAPTFQPPAAETPAFESFSDVPMGDGFAAAFSDADGWDIGAPAPTLSDPFASPAEPPTVAPAFEPVAPFVAADLFAADPPDEVAPPAEAPPPDAAPGFTFEDLTPAFEVPTFESPAPAPAAWTPAFEPATFGTPAGVSPTTPAPAVHAPAPPSETAWIARADRPEPTAAFPTFQIPTFEMPAAEAPTFAAPAFEAPTFEAPVFAAPTFEAPAFAGLTMDVPPPAPVPDAAAPYVPPAGADTLTVISTIDDLTQQALYMAGVTSLDEIARWNRTDARRISSTVGVSEDTILNHWVFEAQAALFQSFSSTQR
ncbi:MAG TPA: hypothetical protein VGB53_01260 [Rubricoccaceae bacterium]|jgi:predicted flap endonuclease-1-like 5' DNA nuclease